MLLSRVRLIRVRLVLVNLNPINDTEWVVFTSSSTAMLELTKVLDAGKNWK